MTHFYHFWRRPDSGKWGAGSAAARAARAARAAEPAASNGARNRNLDSAAWHVFPGNDEARCFRVRVEFETWKVDSETVSGTFFKIVYCVEEYLPEWKHLALFSTKQDDASGSFIRWAEVVGWGPGFESFHPLSILLQLNLCWFQECTYRYLVAAWQHWPTSFNTKLGLQRKINASDV